MCGGLGAGEEAGSLRSIEERNGLRNMASRSRFGFKTRLLIRANQRLSIGLIEFVGNDIPLNFRYRYRSVHALLAGEDKRLAIKRR